MSTRDLLMSANVTFWFADAGRLNETDQGRGIDFDRFGNVYVAGYPSTTGTLRDPWYLSKYSPDGSLIWQKNITGNGSWTQTPDDQPLSMKIIGSYIYMYGCFENLASVIKLDLDGTVIWKTSVNLTFDVNINYQQAFAGDSIAADQSGNVYLAFNEFSDVWVVKLNSSGVWVWSYKYRSSYSANFFMSSFSISAPMSGYPTQTLLVQGHSFQFASSIPYTEVIEIDLNGNVLSYDNQSISPAQPNFYSSGAFSFSGGFEYLSFCTNTDSVYVYSRSSGWASKISGFPASPRSGTQGGLTATASSVTVMFVYSCFCVSNKIYIFKHNNSGTLLFQRTISLAPTLSLSVKRIRADNYGNIYIVGTSSVVEQSAATNLFFGKIPSDGSLTGTYMLGTAPNGYVDYQPSALSSSTVTVTNYSMTYVRSTQSSTTSTPPTTTSAATFSSKTVII